jgi:hypothetical protein
MAKNQIAEWVAGLAISAGMIIFVTDNLELPPFCIFDVRHGALNNAASR